MRAKLLTSAARVLRDEGVMTCSQCGVITGWNDCYETKVRLHAVPLVPGVPQCEACDLHCHRDEDPG